LVRLVFFVCTHNAGRSVIAEAFFNRYNCNPDWIAKSAGTSPKTAVNPVVVQAMKEKGIDVSKHVTRLLKAGRGCGFQDRHDGLHRWLSVDEA